MGEVTVKVYTATAYRERIVHERGGFREPPRSVTEAVTGILERVRREGDQALLELTARFDGASLTVDRLRVTPEEIAAAYHEVDARFVEDLRAAVAGLTAFHRRQQPASWEFTTEGGSRLGMGWGPLERVGAYVPGGTAIYPSSVLMNVIPARVAGVREVAVVSPPSRSGDVAPGVLVAAAEAGASEIYRIGGAQAVAALAWGTETIPRVDKIVGPGNIYVTWAKKLVFGQVDIDGLHGPSEVAILADDTADPRLVAADLLAQAEHDPLALVVLLTPSPALLDAVKGELSRQLTTLPRSGAVREALARGGALVRVADLEEGMELLNLTAAEHVQLLVARPGDWLERVRHAGGVFVGPLSPVPLGDYGVGPNHVLPTGGTARFSSGLGVPDFLKRTTFLAAGPADYRRWSPWVARLAAGEGLEAHRRAVELRWETGAVAAAEGSGGNR